MRDKECRKRDDGRCKGMVHSLKSVGREMMEGVKEWFIASRPVISMLLVQVFAAGMQPLSRLILIEGTFVFSLLAYRHVVATLCVAPFAFYFERIMTMGFFYFGMRDTSATYSANFNNMVPIFTFLVSIILRMEKLGLKTWAGKAKAIGTVICVGGAFITSLYTGKKFYISHHSSHNASKKPPKIHMLRGTLFLVGSCFSYSGWIIVQGALASAATFCLTSWVITFKGPTYPPMFNPLALVFVAFLEAILLGEPLKMGTLMGMVLIIAGLYSFLWGKTKETQSLTQPDVPIVEASTIIPADSAVLHRSSIAIIVPSSLSDNAVINIENTKIP